MIDNGGLVMDKLKAYQEVLEQFGKIAADHDVEAGQVAGHARQLAGIGTDDRNTYMTEVVLSAFLDVAACHHDVCVGVECCTCGYLRDGIAAMMAGARALIDEELERQLKYEPERAQRRTWLIRRPSRTPRA